MLHAFKPIAAGAALTLLALLPAQAHEFWIAPQRWEVAPGSPIKADLMVGQMLRGEPYPYLSNRFTRFAVTADGETTTVAGSEGDMPALSTIAARPGLNIVAHQTVAFRVTYDDWAVFRKYLADEGLDGFAARHRARGLPETGFAERYTRYAKALVQSGPARPEDRDTPLGLAFELVAGANPYCPGLDRLPVTLLLHGEPVAGHQITVFKDDNGAVTRSTLRTDQAGTAAIPLAPGGVYLVNAVRLEPAGSLPVAWQSQWASMTFRTAPSGN
ncbi:MAG TPA: DUF4198 domain-containing protein [Thermohalobaculum sp.]|nr:DUF4198 domain-containing protein [Thermohalobaculum sp.]